MSIRAFKEIQILSDCYNQIHQHLFLPLIIGSGGICLSTSAYFLMSRFSQLNPLAAIVFTNAMLLATCLILLCFHYPATLLIKSRKSIGKLQRDCTYEKCVQRILFRRMIKSLRPVRVKYLHSVYFDRMTPPRLFIVFCRLAMQFTLITE